MSQSNAGRFVWYELMTTDPQAAVEFYTAVTGWTTQAWDPDYTMWQAASGPLGGTMKLPPEAAKMGAPPHWIASVGVADVDATAAKAVELGGKIYHGPMDIANAGRYAVLADPQGASIAIFAAGAPMLRQHDAKQLGEISWHELAAVDGAKAMEFYGKLFGWELQQTMDMGEMGPYIMFGMNGEMFGGMMNKPAMMPVAAWLYYVHVADLNAAIEKTKSLGGKLLHGPMDVPGGDRVAQMMDPQGAMFALHETVTKA
jgi:predicted enzyme related to lactoylglutathione lyase